MSAFHLGPLVGFDLETTGINVETARIVTAACVYRGPGDAGWTKEWLADAGGEIIPDAAAAIHGVTTERAHSDGQHVGDVAYEVAAVLDQAWAAGIPVVGMNLGSYDFAVLDRELTRAGHDPLEITGAVLDVRVLDIALDRYRKGKRTLTHLCEHYRVALTADAPGDSGGASAHDATADALGSLRILWRMGQGCTLPSYSDPWQRKLSAIPPAELHAMQVEWHKAWATGFQAHLRKTDPQAVVDGSWPLRRPEVAA